MQIELVLSEELKELWASGFHTLNLSWDKERNEFYCRVDYNNDTHSLFRFPLECLEWLEP